MSTFSICQNCSLKHRPFCENKLCPISREYGSYEQRRNVDDNTGRVLQDQTSNQDSDTQA